MDTCMHLHTMHAHALHAGSNSSTPLTVLMPPHSYPRHIPRNNENLARLALKIISPLLFAHVRAAYPGIPVSEQNCKAAGLKTKNKIEHTDRGGLNDGRAAVVRLVYPARGAVPRHGEGAGAAAHIC